MNTVIMINKIYILKKFFKLRVHFKYLDRSGSSIKHFTNIENKKPFHKFTKLRNTIQNKILLVIV